MTFRGKFRSICVGQSPVLNTAPTRRKEKSREIPSPCVFWVCVCVWGVVAGRVRCLLPLKTRVAQTLLYKRVCDPVESLPLCCASTDPQMLPSTHDSSRIALLSSVLIREITARPREDDPDVLQDVQPLTSITDDSFLFSITRGF